MPVCYEVCSALNRSLTKRTALDMFQSAEMKVQLHQKKRKTERPLVFSNLVSHSPGDACLLQNSHRGRKKLHVCPYEGLGSRVQRAQPAGEAVVRFFAKTRADGAHKRCGEKRAGS